MQDKKVNKTVFTRIFFILLLVIDVASSFECFTSITSTCDNNVVTAWNKRNVFKQLKTWIKSVRINRINESHPNSLENDRYNTQGRNCKTISVKKNDIFTSMAPEMFSDDITILGKVTHDDDGKSWTPKQRKFVGPIWATVNDQFEWYIDGVHLEGTGETSKLIEGARMHNGFYYGTLDNEQMKIGNKYNYIILE